MSSETSTVHEPGRSRSNISRWSIEHPWVVIAFYLGVALLSGLAGGYSTVHRKGETIFRGGDPADALYLLLSGRCQSVILLPDGS